MPEAYLEEAASLLVMLPNWLGDVVMCTPALRALHNRFPGAALSVAGRPGALQLLSGLPWIASSVALTGRSGFSGMVRDGLALRRCRPDIAVVLPHSFRAAMQALLSGARVRIGHARNGRSVLLTNRVQPHRVNGRIEPVYMTDEYLGIVKALGCEDDSRGPELAADPAIRSHVRARIGEGRPVVGFAPGAAFGPSKQWPIDRFAAVANALHDLVHARCVLLAGPGEESLRKELQGVLPHLIVCDDGKPSVELLKATIASLDLLVCNDSGPRHVAVAFHVPTVCIMGPTSPAFSCGPYERGAVLRVDVDCGPCQKPVCETDHRCMTRITADNVLEAALAALNLPTP